MKKTGIAAALLAAATLFTMTSCSSKKSEGKADSDTATPPAFEEAAPEESLDSISTIFHNPEKKSETPTDSTYAQTASGLKYMVIKEGTGKAPGAADEVTVHYTGQLTDGTVFDSSVTRGEPATFPLDRVIPGWTEGLQLMKEGGKAIFYIPSALGYGEAGAPPTIPGNADLVFTVELIKVGAPAK